MAQGSPRLERVRRNRTGITFLIIALLGSVINRAPGITAIQEFNRSLGLFYFLILLIALIFLATRVVLGRRRLLCAILALPVFYFWFGYLRAIVPWVNQSPESAARRLANQECPIAVGSTHSEIRVTREKDISLPYKLTFEPLGLNVFARSAPVSVINDAGQHFPSILIARFLNTNGTFSIIAFAKLPPDYSANATRRSRVLLRRIGTIFRDEGDAVKLAVIEMDRTVFSAAYDYLPFVGRLTDVTRTERFFDGLLPGGKLLVFGEGCADWDLATL